MNGELLKYFIAKGGFSITDMAKALNMTRAGFYKKLNGESPFRPTEIVTIMGMCSLHKEDVWDIFFAKYVDEASRITKLAIGE